MAIKRGRENKSPEPDFIVDPKTGKKILNKNKERGKKTLIKKQRRCKKENQKQEVKFGEQIFEEQQKNQYNRYNHGVAKQNLSAFVHTTVREVDLMVGIILRRVSEDSEFNNLAQNTTARRSIPIVFTTTNYLDQQVTVYFKFEMSIVLIIK
ncbi:unnamed protein product [Paramecium octaurelia]|uniref:Uncharacterized protein n=1 Tax=Paramecium octaurelia TaxID=43137 RepID=A0A8S1VMS0_PAROT|nr:unnamed protein product [Paramecium octaurelia]CAD8178187.1 unnamed protein product [Paramecium octaurelia]